MQDHAPIVFVAAALVRLKRWIAPTGSRRERLARMVYGPVLRRMSLDARIRRTDPAARCETLPGWVVPPLPARPRVLVLKLDHIGDLVVAMPALRHLRDGLPDAEITLACGGWNAALARASGLVDRVEVFDAMAARPALPDPAAEQAMLDAFAALAKGWGRFDCAIDLRHDRDTRPLLMQVAATVRAGFAAPGAALEIALPDSEAVSPELGTGRPLAARTRLLMLAAAVVDAVRPAPHPALALAAGAAGGAPYAVLAPGAGAPIKLWPVARMAALGRALAERHGLDLVVLGGPGDVALGAELAAALPAERVRDLTGRLKLDEVPAMIGAARLFVGMDSGLSHLAAGMEVPTVCVMSGTASREVWQVTGPRVAVVTGRTACAPCHYTRTAQCPHAVVCLTVVDTESVLAACATMLAGGAAA